MKLVNEQGQDVLNIQPDQRQIDISQLPSGIYLIQITIASARIQKRIIKW